MIPPFYYTVYLVLYFNYYILVIGYKNNKSVKEGKELNMKLDKIELFFAYSKCILSVIAIIVSILVIMESLNDLQYAFSTSSEDNPTIIEHCKILAFIHHDSIACNSNRQSYIAEVQYDDGDIGYISIDKYDYVTRRINSDAMVVNRKYLQKRSKDIL